ncbi:MAG: hypothetical protein LH481_06950 [Burkholderiales bacterium]|nr:hypothetical protein [Burkholderiales bacterium]
MINLHNKHGVPTAPLAFRLINQPVAVLWITLPYRRFRDIVTAVSPMRDRDFTKSVTV